MKMSKLMIGYAQVNANPPLGIGLAGYYVPRFAKGFLDDIEVEALAVYCNEKKLVLISVDCCQLKEDIIEEYCKMIEKATTLSKNSIFISATHTHTGPLNKPEDGFPADEDVIKNYKDFLGERIVKAVRMAFDDLKFAQMGYIVGNAPERVAYIRRYRMKNGTTCTCPPINDPNIDYPIGEVDRRVNVLRFDRKEGCSIVLVNYGLHADTTNGELISADWPGWMRKTLEKALDGAKCMFFAGAEGDVGSTNVHPVDGDMNDTQISFDNEMKSPGMARFVGRALAGTVLQVYDKVKYVEVDTINIIRKEIFVSANIPQKKDIPRARKIKELHDSGRDSEIPFLAMELTTVVAEAERMCLLENAPEYFKLTLTGVKIGPVSLIGIPGEPFTDIGKEIQKNSGWGMIMPCALTNGSSGYFPVKSAFEEGGYEARSSRFKSDVAQCIIDGCSELLDLLNK